MKTTFAKKGEIDRKWYIVDAKDQTLGRISTKIANILRGKNKAIFSPHVDCGDYVVVINAKDVKLTGKKEEQKNYYTHSQYPGGLKTIPIARLRAKKPTEVLKKAISGMIPRNKLHKPILSKLKLFAGPEHTHEAQQPEPLTLNN